MITVPESLHDYCELLQWVAAALAAEGDVECWAAHVAHLQKQLSAQHMETIEPGEQCALEGLALAVEQLASSEWPSGQRAQWMNTAALIRSSLERMAA